MIVDLLLALGFLKIIRVPFSSPNGILFLFTVQSFSANVARSGRLADAVITSTILFVLFWVPLRAWKGKEWMRKPRAKRENKTFSLSEADKEEFKSVSLKSLLFASSLLLAVGCASSQVYKDVAFDKNVKEIRFPAGTSSLGVRLKQFFSSKGYKIIAHSGDVVETTKSTDTKVISREHKTRYVLSLEAERTDYCITGSPMFVYQLSLLDTVTGREVVSMAGRDCEHSIAEQFQRELGFN